MEGSASREPLNSEDGQSGATETDVLAESTEEQAGLTVREELIPLEFQSGPIQTCTNSSCDRYRIHIWKILHAQDALLPLFLFLYVPFLQSGFSGCLGGARAPTSTDGS